MRVFAHILSFYIILLAAIPCCAFDNCPDDKNASTEDLSGKDESSDEDCGNCSPFFSCEGCATASISVEHAVPEIMSLQILSVYTCYIQKALPSVEYEFWLPPKSA